MNVLMHMEKQSKSCFLYINLYCVEEFNFYVELTSLSHFTQVMTKNVNLLLNMFIFICCHIFQ